MKKFTLTLFVFLYLFFSPSLHARDQSSATYLQGNICSQAQNGAPVPGLLISLVHPVLGRSAPVFTDNYGNFQMENIPKNNMPYYFEVYWGQRLIYRNTVLILGPVQLQRICM